MPCATDTGNRESEKYCSYCFTNGKLCYEGNDVKEFKKVCYEQMRKKGTNVLLASFFTFMIGFAPRWRKK